MLKWGGEDSEVKLWDWSNVDNSISNTDISITEHRTVN